ncbi:hypothetical protein [Roseateles sp.]|uniref:hypothetical protein n=1 Tax=Roseateles sp. TaxID=1971397 RepID=UPI003265DC95
MDVSLNQVLLAFWRQSNMDSSRWVRVVFYGVVLALLSVVLWFMPVVQMRIAIACTVLVLALFGLWVMLLGNLMQQNHPTTTRLVPGHLRRLRQATLLVWLLISSLQGVLAWLALAGRVPLPPLLLATAAVGVGAGWAQRHWMWAIVLYVTPSLVVPLHLQERLAPQWHALADIWQVQPWGWLALSLIVLGVLLVRLFGTGDASHRVFYERLQRMLKMARSAVTGNRAGMGALGRGGEWFAWPVDALASRWLSRLLARAQPQQASVMARAEIVLHGIEHWLRHGASVGLTLVSVGMGGALTFELLGVTSGQSFNSATLSLPFGLAIAGFYPGFALRNMLWHTRREQALLALLPGMPQGGRLNRAVAFVQLRHFLIAWAASTLLLGGLILLTGNPSVLSMSIAALPLGVLNLTRAPATMRAPTPWTVSRPVLGFMLLNAVLWGACAFMNSLIWPLAAASLTLSAALLAWRWRALSQAPSALPAGRLA